MSAEIIGLNPITVTATTDVPAFRSGAIGSFVDEADGYKEYIYASTSNTFVAGSVCGEGSLRANGFTQFNPIATSNSAPGGSAGHGSRVGVAVASLLPGQYGWFQILGRASITVAAATALGTRINTTATAGSVDDDGTAGARVINGMVLKTAAVGAGLAVDARLLYPTVGATI